MDVRCESCQTVYEFDDARVKETGVTVKCTQCGHIFKVRKRTAGARGPTTLPGMPPIREGSGPHAQYPNGGPSSTTAMMDAAGAAAAAMPPSGPNDSSPDRSWMLRSAGSGEVHRFRDLTTLQQWIVEMKAGRDDEISRNGDRWKRIGGIAELEPFFRVVEQAHLRAAHPPRITRPGDDPALHSTAPQMPIAPRGGTGGYPPPHPGYTAAAGPAGMAASAGDDQALIDTWRAQGGPDGAGDDGGVAADADYIPRRGPSGTAVLAAATVLVLLALVGYLAVYKGGALRHMVVAEDGARGREAWRKGREYFLLDTDDDFQHADQQFQRAQGADENNPEPVAALVELNTTWARHLRTDARLVESSSRARADELGQKAQTRLEEARRYANEARSLGAADPIVNRALADLQVLDGAPAPQVEETLRRAEARRSDDPEVRYLRGALKLREGQLDEGRALLEQADKLNQAQTQHDLLRANYLLAVLHAQAGRGAEARALAQRILDANPHHVRAATLVAWVEAAHPSEVAPSAAAPGAPVVVAAPGQAPGAPSFPTVTTGTVPAPAAPTPVAAAPQVMPVAIARAPNPAAPAPNLVAAPAPNLVAAPAPNPAAPAPNPATPATPTAAARASTPMSGKLPGAPVDKEPRGYGALISAGNKLLERGKGKEAVKMFEKALVEQPGGLEAMTGLAWALLDTEHYGAAADKFKEVLAVMPNNGEAIIGLAETYKLRGDRKRALEWYKKYVEELPRGSKAQMAQANVHELEDEITRRERPKAGEIREAPALPPAPLPSPPSR